MANSINSCPLGFFGKQDISGGAADEVSAQAGCLMTPAELDELVQTHSLLEEYVDLGLEPPMMTDLLRAAFGDAFTKGFGTPLSPRAACVLLGEFLRKAGEPYCKALIGALDQMLQGLDLNPEEHTRALEKLNEKERYLINHGWVTELGGHCLVFEFERVDHRHFNFFVYNLGEGSCYHPKTSGGYKQRSQPWLQFHNVPTERLFYCRYDEPFKSDFIEALLGKAVLSKMEEPKDFYETLLHHLMPYLVAEADSHNFMTPQRDGNCTWKTLRAVMRRWLGKQKDKRTMFFVKRALLSEGFCTLFEEGSRQQRYLLRMCAQKFLTSVAKRLQVGETGADQVITVEEARRGYATAHDLLHRLDVYYEQDIQKTMAAQVVSTPDWHVRDDALKDKLQNRIAKLLDSKPPNRAKMKGITSSIDEALLTPLVPATSTYLVEELRLLSGAPLPKIYAYINSLPLPTEKEDDFWKQVKEPQKCIEYLAVILDGLTGDIYSWEFADYVCLPQRVNAGLGVLAMIHELALRIDRESKNPLDLASYGIEYPGHGRAESSMEIFVDPSDYERRCEIDACFARYQRGVFGARTHSFGSSSEPLQGMDTLLTTILRRNNHKITKALLDTPSVKDALKKNKGVQRERYLAAYLMERSGQTILTEYGYGHVAHLIGASLLAGQAYTYPWRRDGFPTIRHYEIKSGFAISVRVGQISLLSSWRQRKPETTPGFSLYLSENQNFEEIFPQSYELMRERPLLRNRERGEAQSLQKYGLSGYPELKELIHTRSEPSLTVPQLLHFEQRVGRSLSEYEEMLLFDLHFFRRYYDPTSPSSYHQRFPTLEALQERGTYFEQIVDFIEGGLIAHIEEKTGPKPNVERALFYVRLRSNIARLLRSEEELPPIDPLLTSLEIRKDLTQEELRSVMFNRVYGHCWRENNVDLESCKEILEAWILFKQQPKTESSCYPYLEAHATQFVRQLLINYHHTELPEDFVGEVCTKVSEHLQLTPISDVKVVAHAFPIYRIEGRDYWRAFDLFSGEISDQDGIIGTVMNFPTTEYVCQYQFIELFGERTHHYRQEEGKVCFSDPVLGEVRYANQCFSCQIHGSWAQFVPKYKGTFPPILNERFHVWFSPEDRGFFLTDPKTGDVCYHATAEGTIFDSKRHVETQFIPFSTKGLCSQFADYRQIICSEITELKTEIELPLYQNLAGQSLIFHSQAKGAWVWGEHSKYRLSAHKQGVCGAFPHYLLLHEHEGKHEKVLIPCCPFVMSSNSGSKGPQIDLVWDASKSITYIECELEEGGRLATASVEGKLYLAMMMLEQKRYREAHEYLKQIEPTHRASPFAGELLGQIISLAGINYDNSSNRAAICLKAYFCASRFYNGDDQELIGKVLDSAYTTYGASVHTRDHALNLSPEEVAYYEERFPSGTPADPLVMGINLQLPYLSKFIPLQWDRSRYIPPIAAPHVSNEEMLTSFSDITMSNLNLEEHFWPIYTKIRAGNWNPGEQEQLMLWLGMLLQNDQRDQEKTLSAFLCFAVVNGKQLPAPPISDDQETTKTWWGRFIDQYLQEEKNVNAKWKSNVSAVAPQPKCIVDFIAPLTREKAHQLNRSKELKLKGLPSEAIDPSCQLLFDTHFEKLVDEHLLPAPLTSSPDLLDEIEKKDFQNTVANEIEATNSHLLLGKKALDERRKYQLTGDLDAVGAHLNEWKVTLKEDIITAKEALLVLANKQPADECKRLIELSCSAGLVWNKLSIEDLQWLFLEGNEEAFCAANPNLSGKDACELYEMLARYFSLRVQLQRIQRSQRHLYKLKNGTPEKEKVQVANLLAHELNNSCNFDPHNDPILLLFEYLSSFRLRPQQAELLQKIMAGGGDVRKFVFQMIMGGGKTSIFATILSARAAARGAYSLVVVPPSLRVSVRENLRSSLRSCFNRTLVELTVKREEVDLNKIEEFQRLLDHAIDDKEVILTTADDLAALELKFIEYIYHLKQGGDVITEIQALGKILTQLHKNGHAIGDECDLLFSALHEVNYPIGHSERINKTRINLVGRIYSLLISDSLGINELVHLRENDQANLSPDAYHKQVKPSLAKALSLYSPLGLQEDEQEVFRRYVSGELDKNKGVLTEEDRDFFDMLDQLEASDQAIDRERGHLIALSKYLLTEILPVSLSKEGGRHYGRKRNGQTGKVVPYLAVDTPATTEFGNHWEGITRQFQTALQFGVELKQVKEFAEILFSEALARVKRSSSAMAFSATPEATYFAETLQHSLKKNYTQGELESLQKRINEDPTLLLILEGWTAEQVVTHFPQRVKATAQSVIDMIPTWIAMSGTPDNANGYDPAFEILVDKAAEAQIAVKLLNDAENNPDAIHIANSTQPAVLLNELLDSHPTPEKVRCLLDAGGYFKEYDNEVVARALLAELQRRDPTIEGILFFDRVQEDDEKEQSMTPDTLCALKSPEGKHLVIGKTELKAIKKVGLCPENYFTFYDERHTTGTDIPQLFDAIGLLICDERFLTSRTLYQTALRLRGRLDFQSTEYVIPKAIEAKIPSIRALICSCLKNQAIKLSKEFDRAYKHMIDNVFRSHAVALLRENSHNSQVLLFFEAFEPFLIENMIDEPYQQFGGLERKENIFLAYQGYGEQRAALFEKCCRKCKLAGGNISAEANQRLEKVYEAIWENRKRLQKEISVGNQATIGITQEIELQQEVEQAQQQELQLELQSYLNPNLHASVKPEKATTSTIAALIEQLSSSKNLSTIEGIERLQDPRYAQCFSSGIRLSSGYAHPFREMMSMFEPRFRPAGQLLVVKNQTIGTYRGVLLSEYEAAICKSLIDNEKEEEVAPCWLVQSNGSSLLETRPELPMHTDIQKLLIEVAVLNGDFAFLFDPDQEAALMQWIMSDKHVEIQELRIRLLKLKACQNSNAFRQLIYLLDCYFSDTPLELIEQILANSDVYNEIDISSFHELGENELAEIVRLPKQTVNKLLPNQVRFLSDLQLRWLQNPELIRAVNPLRVNLLHPSAMHLMLPEQLKGLTTVSMIHSIPLNRLHELEPEQLAFLSNKQVRRLHPKRQNHPAVIEKLPDTQWVHLKPICASCFSSEKVATLNSEQHAAFIQHLEKRVAHLVTKEQLSSINPLHVGYLTDIQLSMLDFENHGHLICHLLLDGDYLALIGEERAVAWMNQLDNRALHQLNEAYYPYIAPELIDRLSVEQMRQITHAMNPKLVEAVLFARQPKESLKESVQASVPDIDHKDVDRLNPYYISRVSLAQLRNIRNLQLLNAASFYQKLSMNFPQMYQLDSKAHQIAWVFSRLAMAAVIAAAIAYAVNYSYLTGGIITIGALLATYQWRYYVIPMELEGQIDVQLPAV